MTHQQIAALLRRDEYARYRYAAEDDRERRQAEREHHNNLRQARMGLLRDVLGRA